MKAARGVVFVLVALALGWPTDAAGQYSGDRGRFRLGQNHHDPFSHAIRISFELDTELFTSGRIVHVTMRVKDLLGRLVAVPLALDHPAGEQPVEELDYREAGSWEAVWDGTDRAGRKAPPAPYLLELVVNGERAPPIRLVVEQE